jgi:hypothetical protein
VLLTCYFSLMNTTTKTDDRFTAAGRTHLAAVRAYNKVRAGFAAGRYSLGILEAAEREACRTEDEFMAAWREVG